MTKPILLSIGGGKGGIGKTLIASRLAYSLGNAGYRVVVADLDFGAANLHSWLGAAHPKDSLHDFLRGKVTHLRDLLTETSFPRVSFLAGGQEFWQQIRPESLEKIRLINAFQDLPCDYVILDLGAGTHITTLDFFIYSHKGIVIVVPEPTSIENAYVFMKSIFYRKVQTIGKVLHQEKQMESLLQKLSDVNVRVSYLQQVQSFSRTYPDLGHNLLASLEATDMGIIVNQVRNTEDKNLGSSMAMISRKYFGLNSSLMGTISHDPQLWQVLRQSELPPLLATIDSEVDALLGHIIPQIPKGVPSYVNDTP